MVPLIRSIPLIGQRASSRNMVRRTFMLRCVAYLLPGPVCRRWEPVLAGRFQAQQLEEELEQVGTPVIQPGACLPRPCICTLRVLRAFVLKADECRGSSTAESRRDPTYWAEQRKKFAVSPIAQFSCVLARCVVAPCRTCTCHQATYWTGCCSMADRRSSLRMHWLTPAVSACP